MYTPNETSGKIRAFYKYSFSLLMSIACLMLIGGGSLALVLEPRQLGAGLSLPHCQGRELGPSDVTCLCVRTLSCRTEKSPPPCDGNSGL